MKAEDLMIGNFVNYTDKEDTWIMTIETVLAEGCHTECSGIFGYIAPELLEPIELTEENIVELLGFEKKKLQDGLYEFYYKNGIIIDRDCKVITINENECTLPKHVHKLQQLIKSLEE